MGHNNSWYSLLSKIVDEDAPQLWSIADLEPNRDPKDLAEDLASHFTSIRNEAKALEVEDIPTTDMMQADIPTLIESRVAGK